METLQQENQLLKKIIKIGLPIAMQNFVMTALNLVDNIMIGSRGEVALAAVSLSNRFYFILAVSLFGALSGMGIFTSQYWGVKDIKNIKKIMGMGLTFASALGLIFFLLAQLFPGEILSLFSKEPLLIEKGIDYLKIVSYSYFPMAIGYVFVYNSRSIHRTKLPMITSIIALSINTLLNYILINGKLGFPVLDVKGAAIATLIARSIETLLLLIVIFSNKDHPLRGKISDYFSYNFDMFKKVVKKAFPVLINEASWSLGMSIYFIAYGSLGSAAIASVQVALTISDLFWAFLIGFGNAIAVVIGNQLGAKKIGTAQLIAKKSMKYNLIAGIILGAIYIFTGKYIASIFNFDQQTIQDSINVIIVSGIYMAIKGMNFLLIIGILRSGGDTKFCLFADIFTIYLIGIPLAFITVHVFHLPIHLCVAVVYSEEIFKFIILYYRYKSNKWINILI